jgi:hypothetical protein
VSPVVTAFATKHCTAASELAVQSGGGVVWARVRGGDTAAKASARVSTVILGTRIRMRSLRATMDNESTRFAGADGLVDFIARIFTHGGAGRN